MRDLGNNPASDPVWLTVSEAARYLGISEPTLRKWTDSGSIAVFRTPGRHRRYRLEELDRFQDRLAEHEGGL
jgi:excisionase family DNA binding protein